jgi:hypothetical protein
MEKEKNFMKELRQNYEQARERFYVEFDKMDQETNPYIKRLYIRHKETDEIFRAFLARSRIFRDGE